MKRGRRTLFWSKLLPFVLAKMLLATKSTSRFISLVFNERKVYVVLVYPFI